MTVAAVILFARPEGALADAGGRVAARRMVESAWAGGATPIVVVALDPTGQLAAALAGSPAVLAEPAPMEAGPVGQITRGIEVAAQHVTETDAALIWPGRMAWVDAETVTTLIESHGAQRAAVLRPEYDGQTGWPVLIPIGYLETLATLAKTRLPDELIDDLIATGLPTATINLGDPGVTHDISTAIDDLPLFEGPSEPGAGPPPDWGAAAAEMSDDAPLEGPALVPYDEAAGPVSK